MSLYMLDDEDMDAVAEIYKKVPTNGVLKKLRNALDEVTEEVMQSTLDYMNDEYQIRFHEIVLNQAEKIVEGLLRGETLESFGLKVNRSLQGKLFAYDGAKVREAIVRDFKEDIQNAEILELKEDNERLKEQLKWMRRD